MDISVLTDPQGFIGYGLGCVSGYGFALSTIVPLLKEKIQEYYTQIQNLTERLDKLEDDLKNELRNQIN